MQGKEERARKGQSGPKLQTQTRIGANCPLSDAHSQSAATVRACRLAMFRSRPNSSMSTPSESAADSCKRMDTGEMRDQRHGPAHFSASLKGT